MGSQVVSEVRDIIGRGESSTCDFKLSFKDFSKRETKADFCKDIISLANTPRVEPAYLIFGVDDSGLLVGLTDDEVLDDADIQNVIRSWIYPVPRVETRRQVVEGKLLMVLAIDCQVRGPFFPRRTYGNVLQSGILYTRQGTRNSAAESDEHRRIIEWSQKVTLKGDYHYDDVNRWEELSEMMDNWSEFQSYVLIDVGRPIAETGALLTTAPWSLIVDLAGDSLAPDRRAAIQSTIRARRGLHMLSPTQPQAQLSIFRRESCYWWEANQDLDSGSFKAWLGAVGRGVHPLMQKVFEGLSPDPVKLVLLWRTSEFVTGETKRSKAVGNIINSFFGIFGETAKLTVISDRSDDQNNLPTSITDLSDNDIRFSHRALAAGLKQVFGEPESANADSMSVPGEDGVLAEIPETKRTWLEEDVEVIAPSAGETEPSVLEAQGGPRRSFLRGHDITWFELALGADIRRDIYAQLSNAVAADLSARRTVRHMLYHNPGAGGSTVARRLGWDFSTRYPSVLLHRYVPGETIERLVYLSDQTSRPLLVIVDSVSELSRLDRLFEEVHRRHVVATIVVAVRREADGGASTSERVHFLSSKLSPKEKRALSSVLSEQEPSKRTAINSARDGQLGRSLFLMGLLAFEEEFVSLRTYVRQLSARIGPEQRSALALIATSYYFGHSPLDASFLRLILSVGPGSVVDLNRLMSPSASMLLVSDGHRWRTVHQLVAEELLIQHLKPTGGERAAYTYRLADWLCSYIDTLTEAARSDTHELIENLKQVFIFRESTDLLGRVGAAKEVFASAIEKIPDNLSKHRVLERLATKVSTEPHFWAHLGRFRSNVMKNYDLALEALERAIELRPSDHLIHHMLGMAHRGEAYGAMTRRMSIEEVVTFCKRASSAFGEARRLDPEDEHGYISEAQMLVEIMEYVTAKGSKLQSFRTHAKDSYLATAIEKAEELLFLVRRMNSGRGSNKYERFTRAKLDRLLGDHSAALRAWDSLLSSERVAKPPVRRQIVWTYLRRVRRQWDKLRSKSLARCISLLSDNMEEEPHNESNIRLWFQAIRHSDTPPPIDNVIGNLNYWRGLSASSTDVNYYLYILFFLKLEEGFRDAASDMKRHIEICRKQARDYATVSFEWLGFGNGVSQVLNHSALGQREAGFWTDTSKLRRVRGTVSNIKGPQSGRVSVLGYSDVEAFFVPAKSKIVRGRDENARVDFFIGFSYEGLRAWDVRPI